MKLPVFFAKRKSGSFLFILIFNIFSLSAKPYIEYSTLAGDAYKAAISLRLDEAQRLLVLMDSREPDNLARLHIENYIDFFYLFVKEDQKEFAKREGNKLRRLQLLENANLEVPEARFIQAEILLQWALIRLKFDQKLKAGSEIYEAYKLLEANKKLYPKFEENKKSLSIIHTLAESLPGWIRKVVGIKGSIQLGEKEITDLVKIANTKKDYFFREEAIAINAYIWYYQANKKNQAIQLLKNSNLDHKTNPMLAFLKASLALRHGNNEECIKYLTEAPRTKEYLDFDYLDYMLGRSLLYKLDESSVNYMKTFVQQFKGQHYIKEAYQKIAWSKIVFGNDLAAYKKEMANCAKYGNTLIDEDQQALTESKENATPHPILLKARLLYDGGYYGQAQNILIKNGHLFTNKGEGPLEYHYRLGRTLQALKNYPDAITYLIKTIELGKNNKKYFACNAALQIGLIYEENKNVEQAKKYYNLCLKIKPTEYQVSLHQKAKSGLERVNSK
ncbi:MAG TPA: hypothetical protein PLZ32_06755 [Saprospiraceae bacterium]|nr:hypothetical protein [Saprospiraceae bacterium]